MLHVKSSLLKKSFSSLYFTVGLVEEAAELSEELKKSENNDSGDIENVVSEVGDVCWYLYGLCQSLENVKPEHILKNDINCDDTKDDIDEDLLSVVGSLCGSIKKWSRGDQEWEQFQPRIQLNVSRVLAVINKLSPVPLEEAMKKNIEKIQSRRQRGVVRGDGNNR